MNRNIISPSIALIVLFVTIFALLATQTNTSNEEKIIYTIKLQKAYSQFNDALQEISQDYGCPNDLQCSNLFDRDTTNKSLGDKLVKYFNVKKNCSDKINQGCFPKKTNENYDGRAWGYYELDEWSGYRFITKDNIAYYVWNYSSDCTENYSTGATKNLKQSCGEIYIDVNGPQKGPNVMGRDTFNFWISNGLGAILYPMGGIDTNWNNEDWRWRDPETGTFQHCYKGEKTGWPCAGRIIEENWKMNY